jgi:hypothetical protein
VPQNSYLFVAVQDLTGTPLSVVCHNSRSCVAIGCNLVTDLTVTIFNLDL